MCVLQSDGLLHPPIHHDFFWYLSFPPPIISLGMSCSYEIMHSCWSPVPKCRPSFQQLIDQLEEVWAGLSPGPGKEPLLYVNLEADGCEAGAGLGAGSLDLEELGWAMPWQCSGMDEDKKDWLVVASGAALAIGGDYRYIIDPRNTPEEEGGQAGAVGELGEDRREEEEDVVINV